MKLCDIVNFLQNAADKPDCFEFFLKTFLTNWSTLKEFYTNNLDLKNYATKLTSIPFYIVLCLTPFACYYLCHTYGHCCSFYIVLCHTPFACYYLCHTYGHCCSFFLNSAVVLGSIAFILEIFLEEVATNGEIWPSCRTMNFPIPRFEYTDSNFHHFRFRAIQALWSFYMSNQEYFSFPSSFLVIWIIENEYVFIRSTKHTSIFQGTSISKTFITGQKIIHASSTCAVGKVKCVWCAVASFGILWFWWRHRTKCNLRPLYMNVGQLI